MCIRLWQNGWSAPLQESTKTTLEILFHEVFGDHATNILRELYSWHGALMRPHYNEDKVLRELRTALDCRGLDSWNLKRFETNNMLVRAVCEASWDYQKEARWHSWTNPMDIAQNQWYFPVIVNRTIIASERGLTALGADNNKVSDIYNVWVVDNEAHAHAPNAIIQYIAKEMGWLKTTPMLSTGIREAYQNGLLKAMPIDLNELGYVMHYP